jgi:hypothetical protein
MLYSARNTGKKLSTAKDASPSMNHSEPVLGEHIHPHTHPHETHPHSAGITRSLNRRTLLTGMAAGFGVALCGSLIKPMEASAAGSVVKLPGFSAFSSVVSILAA